MSDLGSTAGGSAPASEVEQHAAKAPSGVFLNILVLVCGSASLGGEIAALRLLAPYFGASTFVWANTIAVVLLALSLGYFVGGRLGDRHPHVRGLCMLIGVAALLYAIVPIAARPFLSFSVDLIHSSSVGTLVGSFLSVVVLVALPMTLLGAVSPWALRLAIRDVAHAGTVAGRMYAISTAGSLVGIMLATLVLIPLVGSRRTFLFFALAMGVIAAIGVGRRYVIVPVLIAASIFLPIGALQASNGDGKVLYEGETPFQYVRVVEDQKVRYLELNRASSVHSIYVPNSYLTGDDYYWDHTLVLPLATLNAAPKSVAILGNAAGTMARSIGHFYPDAKVDGVEIDPKLSELGRRFFDMRNPNLKIFHEDARPWLHRTDKRYDLIVMDAYQPEYIPFYLDYPEHRPELEKVIGRTMAGVFPNIGRRQIGTTTTLLIGSKVTIDPQHMHDTATRLKLPDELIRLAAPTAKMLGPRLTGGEVYTDDRAPVEWLVDLSEY
jgi:predicted membrane-bound spermidine synthase